MEHILYTGMGNCYSEYSVCKFLLYLVRFVYIFHQLFKAMITINICHMLSNINLLAYESTKYAFLLSGVATNSIFSHILSQIRILLFSSRLHERRRRRKADSE